MRMFDVLLRCYPAAFRRRFADELKTVFEAEWTRARRRGRGAAARFLCAAALDALASGAAERRRARRRTVSGKGSMMMTFLADLRYGARLLAREPSFALVAVATLALGIGLSTAIFSAAYDVLLRPLPYPDESRIVTLWEFAPEKNILHGSDTPANFLDWRAEARTFSHLGAMGEYAATLVVEGDAVRLTGRRLSADVLGALGARPLLGRLFTEDDERPGNGVALLSHRVWRSQFGGDPDVVGRSVLLNEVRRTIIGVLRPEFRLPSGDDALFIPLVFSAADRQARKSHYLTVIGRLRPGVTLEAAQSEMRTIAGRLAEAYPDANKGESILLEPIRETMFAEARPALLVLVTGVTLVLLVACVNVGSLLLVRATRRDQEMAIRTALGAGRGRLVRQLFAESIVLATIAGGVGVAIAWSAVAGLQALIPEHLVRGGGLEINPAILCAAAAFCAAAGVVFGLVPAARTSRARVDLTIRDARGTASRSRTAVRQLLVASQVALAVILLTGTGLLLRSFAKLTSVDPGFETERLLTLRLELPRVRYRGPEEWTQLLERITDELGAIPGVTSVAGISWLPLSTEGGSNAVFVEGRPLPGPNENTYAIYRLVTPGFFKTLGIPVVAGRDVSREDRPGGLRVGIISRLMAERLWPGEPAIGKRLTFAHQPKPEDWITVVGVVENTHIASLDEAADIQLYAPASQEPHWFPPSDLAIRTSGDPLSVAAAVRERLRAIDPLIPVSNVQTMRSLVSRTVAEPRFNLVIVASLGSAALVLATIGIYGLLAFSVAVRQRELGVRSALGASPSSLVRLIVADGMRIAGIGMGAGLLLSLAAVRSMRSLLFEVEPTDPVTFVGIPALLLVVALWASYVPARRAARLDPLLALRKE